MVIAWAVKWAHASYRPPCPEWNDTVAFASKWLMDDVVVLEPSVGLRPWLSMDVLKHCMLCVWGPDTINEDKKREEGSFAPAQLLWGLWMDFQRGRVSLPDQKCTKGQVLLAQAPLAPGCREVPLRVAQEVAGFVEFCVNAQAAFRPVQGSLYLSLIHI